MAKFYGVVGFSAGYSEGKGEYEGVAIENPIVERKYYGDVVRSSRRWETGTDINDNLNISNQISILADDYLNEHLFAVKYVQYMGARWKVSQVEINRPRVLLTIGGVYNGQTPGSASPAQKGL